jgi:predicted P-loop ATPase
MSTTPTHETINGGAVSQPKLPTKIKRKAKAKPARVDGGKPIGLDEWLETNRSGEPCPSMHNAMVAMIKAGITCRQDTFHGKTLIGYEGELPHHLQWIVGQINDPTILAIRGILREKFMVDFGSQHVRDAIICTAYKNAFDPVVDMLAEAQANWDGVPRLDRMAVDYFNGEDTPLNRAMVRKTMIAAVRRARKPGCKFDTILVLESEEGYAKSSAWEILAGRENFNDQRVLGKSDRDVQEQLTTCWIHESADLSGMRKAEVEQVKAFASRQIDRARPAYGYYVVEQPRHCINVATTNSDRYLQSQTGNRRFWPMIVLTSIDLEKLKRDRLQLWGEAAHYEAQGESIVLPEELWEAAREVQEERRVTDPWESELCTIPETEIKPVSDPDGDQFVSSQAILQRVLKIPPGEQTRAHAMRLSETMRKLGWTKSGQVMINGTRVRGYLRHAPTAAETAEPDGPVTASQHGTDDGTDAVTG